MPRELALVNPLMMKRCRKTSSLDLEECAKKMKQDPSIILDRESGEKKPSIVQARVFATICNRPLAVLYMSETPDDFQIMKDHRRLYHGADTELGYKMQSLVSKIIYKQEWLSHYIQSEGGEQIEFIGKYGIKYNEQKIVQDIYSIFNVSYTDYLNSTTKDNALKFWVNKLEKRGFFVFKDSSITLEQCRGMAISDKIAPVIFINSNDSLSGQLFSLIHELVHILILENSISNSFKEGEYYSDDIRDIEVFCNRIASLVLVNEIVFDDRIKKINSSDYEKNIKILSKNFKVSEEVIARRLLDKKLITLEKYEFLREVYNKEWQEYKQKLKEKRKEKKSGPSYYTTNLSHNGNLLISTIVDGYSRGKILGRDVYYLLDIKINNLRNLVKTTGIFLSK